MPRQVKFRAIPTERFKVDLDFFKYLRELYDYDGKFVYGSLIQDDDRRYIARTCQASSLQLTNNSSVSAVEVIPETVCEFTGVKDVVGKDIYEYDIVMLEYDTLDAIDGSLCHVVFTDTITFAQNSFRITRNQDPFWRGLNPKVIGNIDSLLKETLDETTSTKV